MKNDQTKRWHEGDVIRKLRIAFGWTLPELARRSQINQQTIHRIEKGETKDPKRDTLTRIAAAFNLTARELDDAVPRSHPGVPLRHRAESEIELATGVTSQSTT